ncbi:MAG: preprotein translocase subunit SecG [Pyrinomonadaceae bacterium]|nr:preprotein translocase subunit SecG [Pyrinomonadaceae bacterium]
MEYLLYGIFFLSCIVLVGALLLQPGKTDAGALFTSNVASSALAPRGTTSVLSKITIAAAVIFMVSALLLSMPALTGNVSVLSSNPDSTASETEAVTEAPANPAPADANANTAAPADNTEAAPAANSVLVPDTGHGAVIKEEPDSTKKPVEKK